MTSYQRYILKPWWGHDGMWTAYAERNAIGESILWAYDRYRLGAYCWNRYGCTVTAI